MQATVVTSRSMEHAGKQQIIATVLWKHRLVAAIQQQASSRSNSLSLSCSIQHCLHIIFCTFSMILGTFCTHQNHCYLYVLFSNQPQSTNFEQNWTRMLHFIGFTSEVGEASLPTLVWAIPATHWRKRTQI